jgi:hypothetical protein
LDELKTEAVIMKNWILSLEYFGGARDAPPEGCRLSLESRWWSLWWFLLSVVILYFCGQSSKFIYIDF